MAASRTDTTPARLWGTPSRAGEPPRTWRRFLEVTAARAKANPQDPAAQFAAQALADPLFPVDDPTRVVRYLAIHFAQSDVIHLAGRLVGSWRKWASEALDERIGALQSVDRQAALKLYEAHHHGRGIASRALANDRKT